MSKLKNFGVLLLATLLLLCVACAGQWQITYAESGNFSDEEISVRHQDEPRELYSGGDDEGNSLYSLPFFENYSLSPGENGMTNVILFQTQLLLAPQMKTENLFWLTRLYTRCRA